jgi:hypothetical protein
MFSSKCTPAKRIEMLSDLSKKVRENPESTGTRRTWQYVAAKVYGKFVDDVKPSDFSVASLGEKIAWDLFVAGSIIK